MAVHLLAMRLMLRIISVLTCLRRMLPGAKSLPDIFLFNRD